MTIFYNCLYILAMVAHMLQNSTLCIYWCNGGKSFVFSFNGHIFCIFVFNEVVIFMQRNIYFDSTKMAMAVRDFDEKTRQDKQKKTYFETMERFLGLRKYIYLFCKSIVSNMKRPLLYYYNHLTYLYTITNYHATVRQLK